MKKNIEYQTWVKFIVRDILWEQTLFNKIIIHFYLNKKV